MPDFHQFQQKFLPILQSRLDLAIEFLNLRTVQFLHLAQGSRLLMMNKLQLLRRQVGFEHPERNLIRALDQGKSATRIRESLDHLQVLVSVLDELREMLSVGV